MLLRQLARAIALGTWCVLSGALHAADASMGEPTAPPALRIPSGARPLRYAATLTVIPGEATAAGEITIDVELDRAHPILWLNAVAVSVSQASVDAPETRVRVVANFDQFVGLAFEPALPAGKHRLKLSYEIEQNRNSTRGVFTLQDAGAWYTMTQFEPIAARQAFPCFDEPGIKVPWQLTLRVPRRSTAVSNTPVVTETDVANDMKLVRFAETEPLPSYLIAFAVGPWEIVDLGKIGKQPTPLRLIAPRGHAAQLAFASRAFPEIFAREERWFDMAYPFAKLDQIAIPLTVRFAMENAGLITYGATILLSPGAATPPFRHGLANVGAHEMAHQWFGNLVTAAWWDDIWLNEAFATWFAEKMVDAWQPGYEHGAQRVHERANAIAEDTLQSARRIREPIVSRGDIFNAFDSITYQKGATVIGMFEGWIGEEAFRRGVRNYLEQHRYGSATVGDFLDALSKASGRPVAPAFSTFLDQNGVPEVAVALSCSPRGAELRLSQHRHAPAGAAPTRQAWQIPVCVRYGAGKASATACTLLDTAGATLNLQGRCPAFVFANAGGRGYYIPSYGGELLERLKTYRTAMTSAEYASLLYDLRGLVNAGLVTGAEALVWIRASAHANDRHVLTAAIVLGEFVRDTLVGDEDRARYSSFVRQVFGPRARAIGFAPRRGERDDDQLLRRALLRFVAPEDPQLAAQARRRSLGWIHDRKAIDAGLADTVLLVAARDGDEPLFNAMLAEAKATTDRLDRRNLMIALFAFRDHTLAQRALGLLLDTEFDIRESATALRQVHGVTPPSREAHDFIIAHFDALAKRVDRDAPGGWPNYAAGFCSEVDRTAVNAFWHERISNLAGGPRNLAQALETIENCTKLRDRERRGVNTFLKKY